MRVKKAIVAILIVILFGVLCASSFQSPFSVSSVCEHRCCPCSQNLNATDTTPHQAVLAPSAISSFRSIPLLFLLFTLVAWCFPSLLFPLLAPERRLIAFREDAERLRRGPSLPQLRVWLI